MAPSIRSSLAALLVLASAVIAVPAAVGENVARQASPTACNRGFSYCGWFLVNERGWPQDSIAPQGLYSCADNGVVATLVGVCAKGCEGPVAHCVA